MTTTKATMRRSNPAFGFFLVLSVSFHFFSAFSEGQTPPSLSLERNYAAALAKAKSDGRLLFVMFEADDCKHCAKFSEKVLQTAVFRNFAKDHLALVFYNFDTLDGLPQSEQKIADQFVLNFDIEITPTILVFHPDGENILKTKGYRGTSADKIVKQLEAKLPK